ncbi:MAG: cyclic nucleotide-binding domain-containing protein [Elusimicrobia bacterium]|nr:cyclic nucleotide-binding domain-containing protein [Elusimicrobiota bacterium]MDE2426077.1 cyclic nucleotide-binding domain-containing protein [Elusimicrobiota bacterium]
MFKTLKGLFFDTRLRRRKAFLRSLPLFADLRERELARLAQGLHARVYQPGETIFLEGDIGRALFILESGKVKLSRLNASASPQTIYTVSPGEFFGEMALLEQLPRTASAAAVEKSQLYLLYRSQLEALLSRHPRIGATVMAHFARLLSSRLRAAIGRGGEARGLPPVP